MGDSQLYKLYDNVLKESRTFSDTKMPKTKESLQAVIDRSKKEIEHVSHNISELIYGKKLSNKKEAIKTRAKTFKRSMNLKKTKYDAWASSSAFLISLFR